MKNSWWWTENLSETCRISFQNKFEKLLHLVGFIIRNKTGCSSKRVPNLCEIASISSVKKECFDSKSKKYRVPWKSIIRYIEMPKYDCFRLHSLFFFCKIWQHCAITLSLSAHCTSHILIFSRELFLLNLVITNVFSDLFQWKIQNICVTWCVWKVMRLVLYFFI